MAETPTPNYGLAKPNNDGSDNMSAFDVWLNPNWVKIEDAPAPPSGTTLPQSGSYNLGDRFYKSDTKSIYVLTVKDANWGWHWRPIHDAISPWLTIPSTALNLAGWGFNVVPANPFQIALDHRGHCFWRGVVGVTTGTFVRGTSFQVFKSLPNGIRPARQGVYMLGHETVAVGTDGTLFASWQAGRVYIDNSPAGFPSIRGLGGNADFKWVHMTGIQYAVGTGIFTEV